MSSIKQADHFQELLGGDDRFELVAPPTFALRVFRLKLPGQSAEEVEDLNRGLWQVLQTRTAELLLTQTILPEVGFCIRLVTGSPQTTENHIDAAWRVIRECADVAIKEQKAGQAS